MKTTIFIRLLLATLLPLAFVFALVISTISGVIYANNSTSAKDAIRWEAARITSQATETIDLMRGMLTLAGGNLADLDPEKKDAPEKARAALRRLMEANETFQRVWFSFEPGVFPNADRTFHSLLREANGAQEPRVITSTIPGGQDIPPWYVTPVSTGRMYLRLADISVPGHEEAPHTAAMAAPVLRNGRSVGALGIDISHADLFAGQNSRFSDRRLVMLFTSEGNIVYSSDASQNGLNIFDMPFPASQAIRNAVAGNAVFLTQGFAPPAGEDSLICLYPLGIPEGGEDFHLYLSIPTKDTMAMARSSVELLVSTSVLGFFLLGFSVFVATRNIVRPIKRLTVNFNRIANGDLDMDAGNREQEKEEPGNVIELDILRRSMWKMLAQISQTHELRLRAAEEQMEKEKVLAASEAKSQFLANMSHEIRTPMNAIHGISEILLHNNRLNEQELKYVNDIKVSSDALLAIINDILDISRLESGKLTLSERDFDFPALLGNLKAMGEYLSAPNGLRFEFQAGPSLPLCLRGDEVRLRQILLNLLSNACKFTTRGGVTFRVESENGMLRFAVSDTGQGIGKEDLPLLFEPFRRVEKAWNRNVQGTGLGLPITKNLVEMMGGVITVESEVGRGSTFIVTVPEARGDERAIAPSAEKTRPRYAPGVRVLVVDDNEINLSVAEGLLTDLYGIECDLALSGSEALEKVARRDYRLVFMDQMMPGMDGVETARRIRAMGGKYADLTIVALTANAVKGTREQLLASGINDYLTKPIEITDMDAILRRWIPIEDGPRLALPGGIDYYQR